MHIYNKIISAFSLLNLLIVFVSCGEVEMSDIKGYYMYGSDETGWSVRRAIDLTTEGIFSLDQYNYFRIIKDKIYFVSDNKVYIARKNAARIIVEDIVTVEGQITYINEGIIITEEHIYVDKCRFINIYNIMAAVVKDDKVYAVVRVNECVEVCIMECNLELIKTIRIEGCDMLSDYRTMVRPHIGIDGNNVYLTSELVDYFILIDVESQKMETVKIKDEEIKARSLYNNGEYEDMKTSGGLTMKVKGTIKSIDIKGDKKYIWCWGEKCVKLISMGERLDKTEYIKIRNNGESRVTSVGCIVSDSRNEYIYAVNDGENKRMYMVSEQK